MPFNYSSVVICHEETLEWLWLLVIGFVMMLGGGGAVMTRSLRRGRARGTLANAYDSRT